MEASSAHHAATDPFKHPCKDEPSDVFTLEVGNEDDERGPLTPFPTAEGDLSLVAEGSGGVQDSLALGREEAADLHRKVLPDLEEEENVCSICLDEFTEGQDPAMTTTCGHGYHLQCIMQWAQRSRECPLCFRTLELQDETMNELLPFGEYTSPDQRASTAAMLESWELERFLIRLAAADQRAGGERRSRHRMDRHRMSPTQPIHTRASASPAAVTPLADAGASIGAAPSTAGRTDASPSMDVFPASWPPRSSSADAAHIVSPTFRTASQALKSKLASLRLRDSINKTTKELKSLFGAASSSQAGPSND